MIPTGGSLEEAVNFYRDHMGFTVDWQDVGMAAIRRGAIAFQLVVNDNKEWAWNSSYNIGVSDLDALYEEYRALPCNVGPLEVKPWGRREFHMIVPSGVCLHFYQS
jgi:hypothetical protein